MGSRRSAINRRIRWLLRPAASRRLEAEWRERIEQREAALRRLPASSHSGGEGSGLHILYAVCHRHMALLRCSLASVLRAISRPPTSVTFLQDCASPLSEAEREELRDGVPCRSEFPTSAFPLAKGPGRILSQLDQFIELAGSVPASARILKLDTDILFLGRRHVELAEASSADLFGQHTAKRRAIDYAQGGCYFLRAGMVRRWARTPLLSAMQETAWKTNKISIERTPEDAFYTLWTRRAGGRVELASFYFEPEEEDWTALDASAPGRVAEVLRRRTRGSVFHARGRNSDGLQRLADLLWPPTR